MTNSHVSHTSRCAIFFLAAFVVMATVPLLSNARLSTSVNIVNNSNREIRNVYLSNVDSNDWSGNQLGDSVIAPGQSYSLSNVACDQQQVKVIGEDQDGCFVTTVVSCGESSTWTVTNDTSRNCGN